MNADVGETAEEKAENHPVKFKKNVGRQGKGLLPPLQRGRIPVDRLLQVGIAKGNPMGFL